MMSKKKPRAMSNEELTEKVSELEERIRKLEEQST